ncbi:MAG: AsmA family protein [Acidobacteriia bacterium]|nr:AsmA family protein [Terriglobia bacterium]
MASVVALVLILFLFRPGVYRLRNRISNSIGSALGRKVELDNVHFHLLPRPGFALEGLVIYDVPEFSAEPMIRAQDVSAAIRFRSLLRGRLEIATLSATEPSINLVRNDEGRWNLASLLERNAQIPAAPTGKPASERRPAFPYLEATGARINFKLGQTKKSYALINADVALWQESENSWGARLKAEPVRTDFNLTDTGLVQINATWQRAPNLRLTPVEIAAQWQNGQLGQITKLLSGRDRGWRGGVTFTAKISGTPEALRIETRTAIDGFRRYDIAGSENVRLATVCSGQYNTVTSTLADLLCESPVSSGTVRLRGNLAVVAQKPTYDLTLEADKVPVDSLVRLLRQAKQRIPGDLTATGLLNAQFRATRGFFTGRRHTLTTQWTGSGSATKVHLLSNARSAAQDEVAFGTIPLALVAADPTRAMRDHSRSQDKEQDPAEPHLRIGPVALTMNSSAPMTAGGWMSAAGYRFFLRGDMDLEDLYRVENDLGLPVARPAAEGEAKLDVNVSGPWQGFAPLAALGTAQLRSVRAEVRGLNTPIEIGSATMTLVPGAVRVDKISARTGNTHWSGAVTAPRHCALPPCVFQFDLTADQLSTGDLAEWFTPHPAKRPWYRILNPNSNPNSDDARGISPLLAIRARGSLQVGRFGLKKVVATQLATQVDVDRGKITLTALRGHLLQGTHHGNWAIDVSARDASSPPVRYHASGTLQNISLAQVSELTLANDAWITGTADGKFDVEGSADGFRELLAHSEGKLQFVMRNGSLPRINIPGSPAPLPVHRFSGDLLLKKGAWDLSAGRLESRDGFYRVRGTASPATGFDFVLTRGDERSWNLTGTLAKPHVAPVYPAEAKRAEADAKTVKP